jgi:hypothetical protein
LRWISPRRRAPRNDSKWCLSPYVANAIHELYARLQSAGLAFSSGKVARMTATYGSSTQTSNDYLIPKTMQAWVLGGPEELALVEKPVPEPGLAEVLVRIDAVAICATDLEIIRHGLPASIEG